MKRRTLLWATLLALVVMQIVYMSSSPGFQQHLLLSDDNNELRGGGRYSSVIPVGHPGGGVFKSSTTKGQSRDGATRSQQKLNNKVDSSHTVPTVLGTSIAVNLSPASLALSNRVVQRRTELEKRQREQQEQQSAQAKLSRYIKGIAKKVVGVSITEEGRIEPSDELADTLKVRTEFHHFTEEELLERYQHMDIVYTWVNGSEYNHLFRKYYRRHVIKKQYLEGDSGGNNNAAAVTSSGVATPLTSVPGGRRGSLVLKPMTDDSPNGNQGNQGNSTVPNNRSSSWVPAEINRVMRSLDDITSFLNNNRIRMISSRDRESDELRYSMRSLDQYVEWHHGRIIVVSPGHCPLWLDHTQNFFARSQRPAGHVRRRVVAVHQDAIVPGNQRLTFNTNGIEQHVYRLQNLSALFVQFNDDYFVNRPTSPSDFVNRYGGPNMLHEGGEVRGASLAQRTIKKIWLGGVYNSNSFNIRELEEVSPLYVPKYVEAALLQRAAWLPQNDRGPEDMGAASTTAAQSPEATAAQSPEATAAKSPETNVASERNESATGTTVDVTSSPTTEAHAATVTEAQPLPINNPTMTRQLLEALVARQNFRLPNQRPEARLLDARGREMMEQHAKRKRYFLKHAPFVYCKRMFEHLAIRYEREFLGPASMHEHRNKADLLMPFIHNAFVVDRPWAGSPQYLPHILNVNRNATSPSGQLSIATIRLDNEDGCAPGVSKIGEAAQSLLVIFTDDMKENEKRVERLAEVNPLFFALNDGFSRPEPAEQLKRFMRNKFPDRSVFETADTTTQTHEAAPLEDQVDVQFRSLMSLPVVVLVNKDETDAACPFVRSLGLALPQHTGRVLIVVDEGLTGVARNDPRVKPDTTPRLITTCVWNEAVVQTAVLPSPTPHDQQPTLGRAQLQQTLQQVRDVLYPSPSSARAVRITRDVNDLLPAHLGAQVEVSEFVFDLRRTSAHGPHHYSILGQTLAFEDMALIGGRRQSSSTPDEPSASSTTKPLGSSLYLSHSNDQQLVAWSIDAAEVAEAPRRWSVNWIVGTSAEHLLYTYPVAREPYESVHRLKYSYAGDTSW